MMILAGLVLLCLGIAAQNVTWSAPPGPVSGKPDPDQGSMAGYRSPVDLVLAIDGAWLVTANETAGSISLVDTATGSVVDELACGERPAAVALCLDNQHVLVSCSYGGQVFIVAVAKGKLIRKAVLEIGREPTGLAVSPDGKRAYVGLVGSGKIAELDLVTPRVAREIAVGRWPRYMAVSPDGKRLAVGCSGESKVSVIDTERGEVLYDERLVGAINIGHMQCSADSKHVYFPWMVYRSNPITTRNIRQGWVLASRIARVRLDRAVYREAISLDVPRRAVADPHGLVISGDEHRLVASASGTHELLVYRRPDLPFRGAGGNPDLIDRRLIADQDLFYRIDVGGRPMGLAMADDDRTVYVANYIKDCVQVVDIESRKVTREIALSRSPQTTLARRGMEVFYDGQRSLDQWYSCHSCHYNGGVSAKVMDTFTDGSPLTAKVVPPLYHLPHTSPWTWHGWQADLNDAMKTSFTTTMLGSPINDEDTRSILAFFGSLKPPPNPFRKPDGTLSDSAVRGKKVFASRKAACAECHSGPYTTDGEIHDVGTGSSEDRYEGYNTPSLSGLHRKVHFLHDGRCESLRELLTEDHSPQAVSGQGAFSEKELSDLIDYLNSL
jgi:DNA-binding beta-propeller fold protein YncE